MPAPSRQCSSAHQERTIVAIFGRTCVGEGECLSGAQPLTPPMVRPEDMRLRKM